MSDAEEETIIDSLYREIKTLLDFLENSGELSLYSSSKALLSKTLILSSASYFEDLIVNMVIDHCTSASNNDAMMVSFVKKKGLTRQYHTLFKWDGNNINVFLALFGDSFKSAVSAQISSDHEMEQGMKSFLSIGNTRNEIVHLNFAKFSLDRTPEEIYSQYKESVHFINCLQGRFDGGK